jgi:hypothetical protein
MIYHPPVIFQKLGLTKSSGSVSPVPARTGGNAQENLRRRPSFYVSSVEKADDLERTSKLAEETNLASSLSDKKTAAPQGSTGEIKKSRAPDFDDDIIKWVGRVI